MQGKIFVLQDDHTLRPLEESRFESEDSFQELLERYPDLLAGDQMNAADPRRWLLVAREYGIPGAEGAGIRWAVDHLFLDQEGIPTLVEVKRSTDTRLRREVVGQMLDYAANAVVYWPIERIRAAFETGCESRGENPAARIADLLGDSSSEGVDADAFWLRVRNNLLAGQIRLVFVADVIPDELRRIIEFLNGQMSPAEVLGVEIRHFAGQGVRTLVPQVIGGTAAAEVKKSQSRPPRQWDEETFFAALDEGGHPDEHVVAGRLLEWARRKGMHIWWGKGAQIGSFVPYFDLHGKDLIIFDVWTTGRLYFHFDYLRRRPAYESVAARVEVAERLNAIPELTIPMDAVDRAPAIRLRSLISAGTFEQFTTLLESIHHRLAQSA